MSKDMQVNHIKVGSIITEGQMIRAEMSDDHVIELSNSIARMGLLQPIVVSKRADNKYQLLAGAHRLLACIRLGWSTIPAVVKNNHEDIPVKGIALVENIIRKDMSLQEECQAVAILTEEQEMSVSQVCQLLGRSREWVNKRLAAPGLPDNIKAALFDGLITMAAAEEISTLDDEGARAWILNEAIYAKRSIYEIKVMVETYRATPSVTQAVTAGLEKAKEYAENKVPRKACDYNSEVTPLHEMMVLWCCKACHNEIMAIKESMKTLHMEGGEVYDTVRKDGG